MDKFKSGLSLNSVLKRNDLNSKDGTSTNKSDTEGRFSRITTESNTNFETDRNHQKNTFNPMYAPETDRAHPKTSPKGSKNKITTSKDFNFHLNLKDLKELKDIKKK